MYRGHYELNDLNKKTLIYCLQLLHSLSLEFPNHFYTIWGISCILDLFLGNHKTGLLDFLQLVFHLEIDSIEYTGLELNYIFKEFILQFKSSTFYGFWWINRFNWFFIKIVYFNSKTVICVNKQFIELNIWSKIWK